jgi:hypothetical protein
LKVKEKNMKNKKEKNYVCVGVCVSKDNEEKKGGKEQGYIFWKNNQEEKQKR